MERKTYKRRNYFIDKYFQGRFIFVIVFLASIGGLSAVFLFNILAHRQLDAMMYSVHISAKKLSDVLLMNLVYANIFAFILVLAIFLILTNRFNERVAGPLYRVKKDLDNLAAGDLRSNIALRHKDEFKNFASDLNFMIGSVRNIFLSLWENMDAINKCKKDMERHRDNPEIIFLRNREILTKLESMEDRLRGLKL